MTPSNGAVKFSTNIPEIVSLAFSEGRPVKSDYSGDQVMFSLTDGRKMYLAPFVAEKIAAAGIGAHQPFEICKREVTQGNRRTVEFQVRPLETPAAAAHAATTQQPQGNPSLTVGRVIPANGANLEGTLEESIARVQAARAAALATPSLAEFMGGMLAEAGIAVLNATARIEAHGNQAGMEVQFDQGAVERMTVSVFIAMEKRSSR